MTRSRLALLAPVAVAAALSGTAFAQGGCTDPLLWDNDSPDGNNGYSNIEPTCFQNMDRTLLDGFSVFSFMQERISSGHMSAGELSANLATMLGYKLGQIGMSSALRGSAQGLRGTSEQSMIDLGWQVFEKHLARRISPKQERWCRPIAPRVIRWPLFPRPLATRSNQ